MLSSLSKRREQQLDTPLTQFVFEQFGAFWPYYLFAFGALVATHAVQAMLPYYAKDLAEWAAAGADRYR